MGLYKAKDEYIRVLRNSDSRVLFNKPPIRPYYYTKLVLNNTAYAIPLSSPKEDVRYNKFTQIELKDNDDVLGKLFLINMIPFHESQYEKVNYSDYPVHYQNLLAKEERIISSKRDEIERKAKTLYRARYNPNHYKYEMLQKNCCDFKVLENALSLILSDKSNDSE